MSETPPTLPALPKFSGQKDPNSAQAVPATAEEAAKPFVCTTVRAALTGKGCVHQIVRVMASAKRKPGNVDLDPAFAMMHQCYGCKAGMSRVKLLGLAQVDELELMSKRSAAERANTHSLFKAGQDAKKSISSRLKALKADPIEKIRKSPKTAIGMRFVYEHLTEQERLTGSRDWFQRPALVTFAMKACNVSSTSIVTALQTLAKQGVLEKGNRPLVEARGRSLDDRVFDKETGEFPKPKVVQSFRLTEQAKELAQKVVYFESGDLPLTDLTARDALVSTALLETPALPNNMVDKNSVGEAKGDLDG